MIEPVNGEGCLLHTFLLHIIGMVHDWIIENKVMRIVEKPCA